MDSWGHSSHHSSSGFTLLEILLAVAIVGVVIGIGIPVYGTFKVRNDLNLASVAVAQNMRRAAVLARGSSGDSDWGLAVVDGTITVFRGDSFALRNIEEDEVTPLPGNVSASGMTEVVFSKGTGLPESIGEVVLALPDGEVEEVSLNEKGLVTY
ncbi:MAG: prepilin-type N-terminal cleavage/methylation domain-containing protein [Candidatus Doudnabacteria bacterium]|nr:prepilin-type N-terminal cleavage/methylation domain-containing protein [Candidatus Doudnabacteria bacterium]MCA9387435.1 prepilin-type N-terminal cleavage/methylation domain-containing protein [Candidatus Andersenbacteria bacterium]